MNKLTRLKESDMHQRTIHAIFKAVIGLSVLMVGSVAMADTLVVPDFSANTAATAASVNTAFATVESSVNDNDARITTNTSAIGTNATAIGDNTNNIGNNAGSITTNTSNISTNTANIADNFSAITGNTADISNNYSDLDQRIIDLGQLVADQSNGIPQDVALDCVADPDAFLNTPINSHTTYILTGMCNGPIWIENRRGITLKGDGVGSKNDGIILQPGLTEHPYAVLGVWDSKAIVLDDLELSAINYRSKTYSFGDNVASLSAGNQSKINASNVNFIGGDYSVEAYAQAMLRLGAGIQITGFNRAGLGASTGGLIRTHDDITVTGIVDNSTDDYINAVYAVSNGVVEIRDGGTFTAGTTTRTIDSNGFTIYPAAVWAGENGSIRVRDGINPAVFNGAVEAGYSASIRIFGNTTIHGLLAAYHGSTIRVDNIVQDSGEVWAGDNGYLRIESSTITPGDTDGSPDDSISLYRNGIARINNSILNLGGINISAYGFTVLNLRGTTNLGADGVDCGDSRNVSIFGSVTLGTVSCLP
jgi:hypothetical protein